MSLLMAEWRAKKSHEDDQLHQQLCTAVASGVVEIHTDQRMLDFQGSPVHSPWDHLVPLTALMLAALGVLLFAGVAIGIIAMTMGVFGHVYGVKYLVAWRIRQRAVEYMLASPGHWQQLWHLGGIVILVKGTNEYCMAPKGDWRKFARRNLATGEREAVEEPAPAPVPVKAPAQPDEAPVQEILPP